MSSVQSVLHADDVRLGHCNNTTRVPAQKLNNYRSDRWNARKCFFGVSGDCFTWSSAESVLQSDDVSSGNSTDTTKVAAQKVHNYRSDRRIALKCFSGVSIGCFPWSSLKSVLLANVVRSGRCTETTRVPAEKVHNFRSDRWISLKSLSGVFGGCYN